MLPRDTDLDVLEAVSRAGRISQSAGSVQPSDLLVIRRRSDGQQINIRVDLNRTMNDPSQRILVAPGDTLLLRHKPSEKIGNVGIGIFNTYGIRGLTR